MLSVCASVCSSCAFRAIARLLSAFVAADAADAAIRSARSRRRLFSLSRPLPPPLHTHTRIPLRALNPSPAHSIAFANTRERRARRRRGTTTLLLSPLCARARGLSLLAGRRPEHQALLQYERPLITAFLIRSSRRSAPRSKTMDLEKLLLARVGESGELADTGALADELQVDHQKVVGVMKSLIAAEMVQEHVS